jgi:mono/diheme cytochrome c family protein/cytochrome bd-type quinol oxidase subunit 1
MNYPLWELPAPGLLIAAIAIVHVFISHFAVGGGLFLVLAEKKARVEDDPALLGFVRSLSRFFVLLTLVLGALTGVGIWFTIALVHPQATSALVTTFVWGWAIEWTFFAVEITAAMVYYYGWDRLDAPTHMRVGWVYFISAWASLAVISGILSFMATSGDWVVTRSFTDGFFNPTYWPTVALRTAVAAGLAGLYALLAASLLSDADLKARIAHWSVARWIVPAAVLIPATLLWYLAAAAGAGTAIAETLGATDAGAGSVLAAVLSPSLPGGHPIVRRAALVTLVGAVLLVAGALGLATLRARSFGRIEAGLLMLLGLASMGGSEWVREGLRKPWVIDRHMFVNAVRVPVSAGTVKVEDPFTVDVLDERGVLTTALFARVPEGYRPGHPDFDSLEVSARADLEAQAGREVFRLQCASCHTENGHLGIQGLVEGRDVATLQAVLDSLARPVTEAGRPTDWSNPSVRVHTRLGRRMPPFVGTEAERRAVAIHLARLGGDPEAGTAAITASTGVQVFDTHCAACHGPDTPWPMADRLRGRSREEFYDLIGRLDEVREEMAPFSGTEPERAALAEHLAGLAAAATGEEVTS